MDNKPNLSNPPVNNNINGLIYPNNYNLLIQNHLQIPKELELQKNPEIQNDASTQNKLESAKEDEPQIHKRKRTQKKNRM